MKSYNQLSPFIRGKVDEFLEYAVPTGVPLEELLGDNTSILSIIRAAEGFLYRDNPGDSEKAIRIIKWVMSRQFKNKFQLILGNWNATPDRARFNFSWRESVGCELILIYENYKDRLPKDIVELLLLGIQLAAWNSKHRNVSPFYTNMATMSAILMEYVGRKFEYYSLERAGLHKATKIFEIYFINHSFSEFNSPTYSGIICTSFNLWKKYGSLKLQKLGEIMETELWLQTSDFYNFNLENICGPYIQADGMNMMQYSTIIGLWMSVVLDNKKISPYPQEKDEKYSLISNIIPIVHLDPEIPEKAMQEFTEFSYDRFREGTIVKRNEIFSPRKKYEMSISANWMMGGLRRDLHNWSQRKIGTIHWKDNQTNKIGWLLVPGDGKADVVVTKGNMSIFAKLFTKSIRVFVQAPNLKEDMFTSKRWNLPGITFNVYHHKTIVSITRIQDIEHFRKRWAIGDEVDTVFEITCNFKRKLIRQQALTLEINF
jgi:hypothetical protein